MPTVQLDVQTKYSRRITQLLRKLNDKSVRKDVNQIIADAIQPYVPMKSGKLRRSLYVGTNVISWGRGLPYARYQFEGEVWGPNFVGWTSPNTWKWKSGSTKHPTGRELGVPGFAILSPKFGKEFSTEKIPVEFGYTTEGTKHHWTEVYQWKLKSDTNKKITRYIKQVCKDRGINP